MKLYIYDHCPFCVRARMAAGLFGADVEEVVLANDDEATPIGMIGSQPMVLVASQKAGVKTAAEFSALVAKNPGKFSYGSSGVGTALHLAGEMIKEQGKLHMTHIPYRGGAPLTTALGGRAQTLQLTSFIHHDFSHVEIGVFDALVGVLLLPVG